MLALRLFVPLTPFAAIVLAISLPAAAAGPPATVPLPSDATQRAQTQLLIQQAQAQARLEASEARVQARLNANQARLQAQLDAEQAGMQMQLSGAGQRIAAMAPLVPPPPPLEGPARGSSSPAPGTMELVALTPRLGRYFGADHGVLVVRAPAHGVLRLEDGDVILSIGGRVPASSSQAIRILTSYDPGDRIRLVILREHHRIDIAATLPASPAGPR